MKKTRQVSLAVLRNARGLSQKDLANEMNVSAGLIGMYESGKRKPSYEKAMFIAKFFNTPLENISFATQKSG